MNKQFRLSLAALILPIFVLCQPQIDSTKSGFRQQDIKDWMIGRGWIKPKAPKDNFLLLIPILASNPAAGVIFGAGLSLAYKQKKSDTRLSAITANATYSTNKLLNLNVKSNVFVFRQRMLLNGDWRYLVNFETTYGLGTNRYDASAGGVDLDGYPASRDSLGQTLQYHQVRIHETASWEIIKNFFAGFGVQIDYHYAIRDDQLNAGDSAHAYHYNYNVKHGFNTSAYLTSGISLNLIFDSRDNQVNAYRGYYANLNYRINTTDLGSAKNSQMLLAEFRSFFPLDNRARGHVLGFWLYGNFLTSGSLPYLMLPGLGYDQRQRTGRGYVFGRFRGESLVYGESEYRFPISAHTGILGGVLFVNLTTTSDWDKNIHAFDYMRSGYGGGLRITLDKRSRTRLAVDAGIAEQKLGFYFGAQETF